MQLLKNVVFKLAAVNLVLVSMFSILFIARANLVGASSLDFNYTYGMGSVDRGLCKRAVQGGDASLENIRSNCWNRVTTYCENFVTDAYKWGCYGKWFDLQSCVQTGTSSAIQRGIQACKEANSFRCYAIQNATYKTACIGAGQRDQFGIILQNSEGGSTPAGGGSTTNPQSGGDLESQVGPTEEELAAQRDELRDRLSKGDNNCGTSSTVFDFGCVNGVTNPILALIFTVIRFITYGMGILLTLALVISGIQYITAQGDANTVKKARMRIFNIVVALLLYLFAFAVLNYLVPGGLIS